MMCEGKHNEPKYQYLKGEKTQDRPFYTQCIATFPSSPQNGSLSSMVTFWEKICRSKTLKDSAMITPKRSV
jgi:hypothetical protein